FVGTKEGARGRGVGGRLVTTALRWMLSYEGIDEVWLSVDENNLGAQRLYERLGWDVIRLTQAFRLQSQPAP
ncbi:MAG: GNAT family N-acetyltransferase, partial [Actinomycetota bacterium]